MSLSPLNNLSGSYLQSVLGTSLQNLSNSTSGALSNLNLSSFTQPDAGQISPFAQMLSTLQQLQQSSPTQYQQMTQQIATSLQNAAQTAQANGNTSAANKLNQLATDFTNASKTGQLPNISDLAQAVGGHHHHGHHAHASSAQNDSASQSTSSSPNNSLNPFAIIESTLTNGGVSSSSGQ